VERPITNRVKTVLTAEPSCIQYPCVIWLWKKIHIRFT